MALSHPISAFDFGTFCSLPEPNDDLSGVPIFSPGWGKCWLGIEPEYEAVRFWHVTGEDRHEIDFDAIRCYLDPMTDNVWLIFYRSHDDASFPFVRCTGEEPGVGYYVPPYIQFLL